MHSAGEEAPVSVGFSKYIKDSGLLKLLLKLALIGLCLWLLLSFVGGVFRVSGNQMYPALRDGDLCVTFRLDEYRSKDVVVFRDDAGNARFARIIARRGDTVGVDEIGLLVNGSHPMEEIFYPTDMSGTAPELPVTLSDGQVFVLNDFRSDSSDSRQFGLLSTADLQGKVVLVLRLRGI